MTRRNHFFSSFVFLFCYIRSPLILYQHQFFILCYSLRWKVTATLKGQSRTTETRNQMKNKNKVRKNPSEVKRHPTAEDWLFLFNLFGCKYVCTAHSLISICPTTSFSSYRCDTFHSWHFHLLEFSFHSGIFCASFFTNFRLTVWIQAGVDYLKGVIGGKWWKEAFGDIDPRLYEKKVKMKMMEWDLQWKRENIHIYAYKWIVIRFLRSPMNDNLLQWVASNHLQNSMVELCLWFLKFWMDLKVSSRLIV